MENLIIGRNAVMEALAAWRTIDKLLVAKGDMQGSVKKIIAMANDLGLVIQYVPRSKLDLMTENGPHQGVAAQVAAYKYSSMEDVFAKAEASGEAPFVIVLDEIEDPHNLGAIIRTAECAGAHGVIISKRRAVGITSVVAKTSAGAIEHIPVVKVANIPMAIDDLKKRGLWIYGADMDGENYHYEQNMTGPIGLVVGSEGRGVSKLVKSKCDFIVRIPLKGQVTSLNASVASAVMIYEIVRQRDLNTK